MIRGSKHRPESIEKIRAAKPAVGLLARMLGRCFRSPDGCLTWTGAVDKGYGVIWNDGKNKLIHSVAYEAEYGPPPRGFSVRPCPKMRNCADHKHVRLVKDRTPEEVREARACAARANASKWRSANKKRHLESVREWQGRNRERVRKSKNKWLRNNKPAVLLKNAEYRRKNIDRIRDQQRGYRLSNPEKTRAAARRYQRKNPDKRRTTTIKYRAKKRGARGTCTAEQKAARFALYGGLCAYCGAVAEAADHVVPLARGGTNWPANIRPACRRCNSSKQHRLLSEWSA